jgi:hypothetical protein
MKNTQKGFIPLLLIIIVATAAVGSGAYYYTKNNSSTEIEVAHETTTHATSTAGVENKSTTTPIEQNTVNEKSETGAKISIEKASTTITVQSKASTTVSAKTQTKVNVLSGYKDCGTSSYFQTDDSRKNEFPGAENDKALACLGTSYLNNCASAQVLLNDKSGQTILRINGSSLDNCTMKMVGIQNSNAFYQCDIKKVTEEISGQSFNSAEIKTKYSTQPATIISTFIYLTSFSMIDSNPEKFGCSSGGDLSKLFSK